MGFRGAGRDWQENTRPQARQIVARMWVRISGASKHKEKPKWAIEKPELDNAWRLRGIYLIDAKDEEFKDIMKNAGRKLNSDASGNAL